MLRSILLMVLCSLVATLPAQEELIPAKWGDPTAYTIPSRKWESGLIQPFRYGWSERVELRASALLMPVLPNLGVKVGYGSFGGFRIAGEHTVSYPTLFLRTVSFKGTGGLISPQFHFPFLLSVDNGLVLSRPVGERALFSANVGVSFTIRERKPDYEATIDLPLIYPRMAHYYEGASLRAALLWQGAVSRRILYAEDLRLFAITRAQDNLFTENSGSLMWVVSRSLRIKGGYTLSWGRYPFGSHWQMWPSFDLVFGSRR